MKQHHRVRVSFCADFSYFLYAFKFPTIFACCLLFLSAA